MLTQIPDDIECLVPDKDMHPLIDKDRQKLARRYRKDNMIISIFSYMLAVSLIGILLFFDISSNFVVFLNNLIGTRFFVILGYFTVLYVIYNIIAFPLSYIGGYKIEHKYKFSTQNFRAWFIDWVKSFCVTFVLGAMIFEVIYLITNVSADLWWFWISLIMIFFSVMLASLFPVLILPLFYKTSPIVDEDLRAKVEELCAKTKINVKGVFSINLSSKSTKANAAVVGLGNTKRILLGDTFISDYTDNEIMPVLAHEITHYREHHIWWLILWQSIVTLTMFYLGSRIYPPIYELAGFDAVSDIAAFPLLALIFAILALLLKPLSAAISRYYERKADKGALFLTKTPDGFISVMAKFCNRQLSVACPHPLIEWYKYSHPSPGKRIEFAQRWQEENE